MLIFDPRLGDDKIGDIVSKTEEKIKGFGGEIEKTDKLGIRRLANVFQKHKKLTQVYYTMIYFKSLPDVPAKILAFLKITEDILRYQVAKAVEAPPLEEIKGTPIAEPKKEGAPIGQS